MKNHKAPALALACLLLFSIGAGCARNGGAGVTDGGEQPVSTAPPAAVTEPPAATPEPDSYTLNEYLLAAPGNWNVHAWETNADAYVFNYTEMPLVEPVLARDAEGNAVFDWMPEMASSIEDITAEWLGGAEWGVLPGETGRVWRIRLNPGACWADEAATPIDADTYIASMRRCLDPAMRNRRADAFYQGKSELAGAFGYYNSGSTSWVENVSATGEMAYAFAEWIQGADGQYCAGDGTPLYFYLEKPLARWLGGNTLLDYYNAGSVPEEVYSGLAALAEDGCVPVTEESIALLYEFTGSEAWGKETKDDLANYVGYRRSFPEVGWETVGLLKEDAYTLLYICAKPIGQFDFYSAMSVPWLVYEPLYDAGKRSEGDLVVTDYGTDPAKYMSCGPYRLVSDGAGERLVFERNEAWYGYGDGRHEGQYSTTRIVTDIIADHDEAMRRFNNGELDCVEPADDELEAYRLSGSLLKTDETYTYRFFMVTDRDALLALQEAASGDGKAVNKVCLAYASFRQAMAYAIDRADFVQTGVIGGKPALGLLNDLFYYDIEHDNASLYRRSDQAKAAVCGAYGVSYGEDAPYATLGEAYAACTGYDVARARELFQQTYDVMLAAGDWQEGMVIELTCPVTADALTDRLITQNRLVQRYLDEATEGTGFEGKLTITYTSHIDRYNAVMHGEVEMGFGAWGGAPFDPYGMMQCYCDPDYTDIQELCGFDPTAETLTIAVGDEEVTKTYQGWSRALVEGGEYARLDPESKLSILAKLEEGLLAQWHFIVLYSGAGVRLYSRQINYGAAEYNVMYLHGGIRYITYNKTDAAWEAYVAANGVLDYTR